MNRIEYHNDENEDGSFTVVAVLIGENNEVMAECRGYTLGTALAGLLVFNPELFGVSHVAPKEFTRA